MVEREEFIILTRTQVRGLLDDVQEQVDAAFHAGCKVGYGDKLEGIEMARQEGYDAGNEAGYEVGYEHGYSQGNDDGYSEGVGEGYDDGFEDGLAENAVRAAEAAAFEPKPAEWVEGWGQVS